MKNLKYIFASLMVMMLGACQEEIFDATFVEEGLPAGFTLELGVPSKDIVLTKSVADYESTIGDLVIFLFRDGQKHVIHLTSADLVSQSTTDEGGRTYKLNLKDAEGNPTTTLTTDADGNNITSGVYKCYAVANPDSPFCGISVETLKGYTEVQLNAAMASNANFVTGVYGSELLPMSSQPQTITLYPDETTGETGENKIALTLKRLTSRIEFNFVNGTNDENPKFTPHSYSVYNIPKKANLISKSSNVLSGATSPLPLAKGGTKTEAELKAEGYYAYMEDIDIAGGSIEFMMLENVRNDASGLKAYTDREKWNVGTNNVNAGATAKEKEFINAPAGSTYIVVKGEYSGKTYFGDISYTIHLGDFGNSTEGYNFNDFSVARNQHHIYTITVNGTNSITTDEEGGGANPGAEGTLTQNEGQQFVLDAHYETVLLSFPLSSCTEGMQMLVDTPFNTMTVYQFAQNNYSDADYKWVHFVAPTSTTALPAFPGSTSEKRTDLAGLAAELENAKKNNLTSAPSGAHYLLVNVGGVTTVYVAAFVNEYFYEGKDWNTFVNAPNRVLMLNPAPVVSNDGNSLANNTYIFSIVQRSIKTVYSTADPSINAFGIETWNETGRMPFNASGAMAEEDDFGLTLSMDDGWKNTNLMWDNQGVKWPNLGYLKPVTDNSKEGHVFYESGYGVSGSATGVYAYNACAARNRDEDGNGNVDDNEIKWYMPATNQYLNLWLGIDYLTGDTQLIDPSSISGMSATDNEIVNYYSSSTYKSRLYYPVEGASYGKLPSASAVSATNQDQYYYQGVRCVRSLKTYNEPMAPMYEKDGNTINVLGASSLTMRSTMMSGEYTALHNERDAAGNNKLYASFEVAQHDLGESFTAITSGEEGSTITWIDSEYTTVTGTYTNRKVEYDSNWNKIYTDSFKITFKGIPGATYTVQGISSSAVADADGMVTVTLSASSKTQWPTDLIITGSNSIIAELGDDSNTINVTIQYTVSKANFDGAVAIKPSNEIFYGKATITFSNTTAGGAAGGSTITIVTGNPGGTLEYDAASIQTDLCASYYYEFANASDKGSWRIPNQREMMLMIQEGFLEDAQNNDNGTGVFYVSRTHPSLRGTAGGNFPYLYTGNGFTQNPSEQRTFRIRCVRDAVSVPGGSENVGGNGGFDGGELR